MNDFESHHNNARQNVFSSRVAQRLAMVATVCVVLIRPAHVTQAQDQETEEAKFRVLGLFMEVRVPALKKEIAKHEEIELLKIDYASGEVTLRLHGPLRLRNRKPEIRLRGLNERVRLKSRGAFEIIQAHEKLLENRTKIEIPIKGHDCLGCSFGAYRAIYKAAGVHRVTADFGERLLVAWIDPKVTNRKKLEAELVKCKILLDIPDLPSAK